MTIEANVSSTSRRASVCLCLYCVRMSSPRSRARRAALIPLSIPVAIFCTAQLLVACSSGGTSKTAAESTGASASLVANPAGSLTSTDSSQSSVIDQSTDSGNTESSSAPAVLRSGDTGRPLTLSDVFKSTDGWRDDRFDIANRSSLSGIGTEVTACYQDGAATLELRLAGEFNRLRMNIGQANTSGSSDQTLIAEVVSNGKQIDSRHIPFNTIQPFDEVVSGANALIIRVYLDQTECSKSSTPSVIAVVQGLVVS